MTKPMSINQFIAANTSRLERTKSVAATLAFLFIPPVLGSAHLPSSSLRPTTVAFGRPRGVFISTGTTSKSTSSWVNSKMSGFYHTPETVDQYLSMADGFDGRNLIKKLTEHLPPEGSRVLELGSGPGKDWEILRSEGFTAVGSDLSLEFLKRLKSKFPGEDFLELDAKELASVSPESFNGIYSNKVLIHLTNDELSASSDRQAAVLKSGGIVLHSFWKGEKSEVHEGLFVQNHTEESLKTCFGEKFDIVLMEVYKEFEDGDSILFIGRKK